MVKSDYPDHAKKVSLLKFDEVLGLGLGMLKKKRVTIPKEIQKLLNAREKAREKKDWKESDRLRDEIARLGFTVEDTQTGQKTKNSA